MEKIKAKVSHLRKKIRNRNILEYLSGVIVITGIIFLYPEVQAQVTALHAKKHAALEEAGLPSA